MGLHKTTMPNMFIHFRFLIAFVGCAICTNAFGQKAAIQLTQRHLLFVGDSIHIQVVIHQVKQEKIIVKTSDNLKYSQSDSSRTITALQPGAGSVIAGYIRKKDTIWVDTVTLRIKMVPMPQAYYGSIEPGSTISRAAVAVQTSIVLRYDTYGLYEKRNWEMLSYRIAIANAQAQNVFNCVGAAIPDSVRQVIRSCKGGRLVVDKILIRNKVNGFTAQMKPIYLKLDHNKHTHSIRYVNAYIRTKEGEVMEVREQTYQPHIIDLFEDVDSGVISAFAFNYRFDHHFNNGIETHKAYFNEIGQKEYVMTWSKNSLWTFMTVNDLDQVVVKTMIHDSVLFIGSESIKSKLATNYRYDSISFDFDIFSFYKQYGFTPTNHFISKHPNGKTKLTGYFTTVPFDSIKGIYMNYSNYTNYVINRNFSVMHGLWTLYDEAGNVIATRHYNYGKMVEE